MMRDQHSHRVGLEAQPSFPPSTQRAKSSDDFAAWPTARLHLMLDHELDHIPSLGMSRFLTHGNCSQGK